MVTCMRRSFAAGDEEEEEDVEGNIINSIRVCRFMSLIAAAMMLAVMYTWLSVNAALVSVYESRGCKGAVSSSFVVSIHLEFTCITKDFAVSQQ